METCTQMPDLMGAAPRAASASHRILAQLEYGPRSARAVNGASRPPHPARWRRFGDWALVLVMLLPTLAGVAWLMHEEPMTPVMFTRHTGSEPVVAAPPLRANAEMTWPAAIIDQPDLPSSNPFDALASSAMSVQPSAR